MSKAVKGLVGGAAEGSAECQKNWTTALIRWSSGYGTHPSGTECAQAARTEPEFLKQEEGRHYKNI